MRSFILPTKDIVAEFRQHLFSMQDNDIDIEAHLIEAFDIACDATDEHFLNYLVTSLIADMHFSNPDDREVFRRALIQLVGSLSARMKDCHLYDDRNKIDHRMVRMLGDDVQLSLLGVQP